MTPLDLRVWRTRQQLTQAHLAERLGVHLNTVNRWENGDTAVPPFLPLALETLERQPAQNGTTTMPPTADPLSTVKEGEYLPGLPEGHNVAAPKCDSLSKGRWYCATHQEALANQFQKDVHIDGGTHRLAWLCNVHGVEVP